MHTLLPRLCLALFACSAAVACEEEGPDGDETTASATDTDGDDETAGATGAATVGVTQGSLAMPPDDDSEGDSTTDDDDDTGPTTVAQPRLETPG